MFSTAINKSDTRIDLTFFSKLARMVGFKSKKKNEFKENINVGNILKMTPFRPSDHESDMYRFNYVLYAIVNVEMMRLHPDFNKDIIKKRLETETAQLRRDIERQFRHDKRFRHDLNDLLHIKTYEIMILKNIHLLEEIGNSRSRSSSSRKRDNHVVEIAQSSQPIVIIKDENNSSRQSRRSRRSRRNRIRAKSLSDLSSSGIRKSNSKKSVKRSLKRANSYIR